MSISPEDDPVRAATRDVATALLPELPAIAQATADLITASLPEFGRPGLIEPLMASVQGGSRALLDALSRGVRLEEMAPSAEVIQGTRGFVRGRLGHDTLMRGYQVGIGYWCERWVHAVESHCADLSLAFQVVNEGITFLLAWLQMITDQLSAEYYDEAERLAREGTMARVAEVQRLLVADDVDLVASSQRLGYDLRGHHVALVLSREPGKEAALATTARALAGVISSARPLVVPVDVDTAWCWVPADAARTLPDLDTAVLCGQGRPWKALEGFRRSHREACEAVRVARLAGRPAGTVTRFAQIELLSLCSADPEACRAFVESELGGLAADTSAARRMRNTLRAFYNANSNFRAAAAQLGLHHNTIRYRLDQAEKRLGRSIDERRLHLELALHLAALLDPGSDTRPSRA